MVEDDNAALVAFQQENPQRKVVLACEEDVTNDTLKDLLIIYKEDDPTEGEITRFGGFDCSAGWKLYLYRTDSGSARKSGNSV